MKLLKKAIATAVIAITGTVSLAAPASANRLSRSDLAREMAEIRAMFNETTPVHGLIQTVETPKPVRAVETRNSGPRSWLVNTRDRLSLSGRDFYCLAKNIYHEAGVEDRVGKFAVAQVTLNRVEMGKWGNSICEVVHAYKQFSWTLKSSLRNERPSGPLWEASVEVAEQFVNGVRMSGFERVTHYHATYVSPVWSRGEPVKAKIGTHVFFEDIAI